MSWTWKDAAGGIGSCLFYLAVTLFGLSAWVTHIYVCFNENHWGFLIAGAICFPLAILHGVGIWFGWWH
jgi:hypothetical protein